jgi:peptidoglycan-N-acetylglucosamine deacetylase
MMSRQAVPALLITLGFAAAAPALADTSRDAGNGDRDTVSSRPVQFVPRPGRVALTFDDGPDPEWTPRLLDLLDRHGVRATFFVQGWLVEAHPEIVVDMIRRGHSVQNHTWNHPNLAVISSARVSRQLSSSSALIRQTVGVAPACMRPPYAQMSPRVASIADGLGLGVVVWTRESFDYTGRSATRIADQIISDSGSGDIILLHDQWGRNVLPALERIIPGIRAKGLEFDPLCVPLGDDMSPRRLTPAGEMR